MPTLPDTRRRSALAAQFAGARANPGPVVVATVAGLINGATMVAGASAIGWSTDHLMVPALSGDPVPAGAWWISALLILGISAARWSTIFLRGVCTGRVQYRAQAETRRAVVRRYLGCAAWRPTGPAAGEHPSLSRSASARPRTSRSCGRYASATTD